MICGCRKGNKIEWIFWGRKSDLQKSMLVCKWCKFIILFFVDQFSNSSNFLNYRKFSTFFIILPYIWCFLLISKTKTNIIRPFANPHRYRYFPIGWPIGSTRHQFWYRYQQTLTHSASGSRDRSIHGRFKKTVRSGTLENSI